MSALRIAVADRDGWRQEVRVDKAIVHVGSDPRNDVVLATARGGGVAARHLQLIPLASRNAGCRLVNVGTADVLVGAHGERRVAPLSIVDLAAQDQIRIGDFTLTFLGTGPGAEAAPRSTNGSAGVAAGQASSHAAGPSHVADDAPAMPGTASGAARSFSLELSFPQGTLAAGGELTGMVTVHHLGDQTGVQFRLEVLGLAPEFYEIGPGPILFPNAHKEIFLRVRHPRLPNLPAGRLRFRVRASAPGAYPGESAEVGHTLYVQAFYQHATRLTFTDE
jgi:hypothetical protein